MKNFLFILKYIVQNNNQFFMPEIVWYTLHIGEQI